MPAPNMTDVPVPNVLASACGPTALFVLHLLILGCAGRASMATAGASDGGAMGHSATDVARAEAAVLDAGTIAPTPARNDAGKVDLPLPASTAPAADPENRARPAQASADLEARARHLFDAIVQLQPQLADDFFFPRAPFIPLKDVREPARYFEQLLSTYHRDIAAVHATRRDWTGATFLSFALGSEPRWVAPGKEYNKIGYYRSFHGKLRYRFEADGGSVRVHELDVGTIISWDGHWYVTHLAPIRH